MKVDLIEHREPTSDAGAVAHPGPIQRVVALVQSRPATIKAGLSIFDQVIFSGAAFASAVIIGRACSEEQLGLYYLTRTFVLVLFGIQANLIIRPCTVFSARFRGRELAEYTGSMWTHYLVLMGIGMLAIVLLIAGTAARGSAAFLPGMLALLAVSPVLMLREFIRGLAFIRLQPLVAMAMDATILVVQLSGLLLAWYLDRVSVPVVFGVMGVACAVACIGWMLLAGERPKFVAGRIRSDWTNNWGFAKWLALSWLTVDTIPFMMPWFIDMSADTAAAGRFGASATLVGVANILVMGTGNFLAPKAAQVFAGSGVVAMRRLLSITSWMFATVFGAFCLAMLFFGDWVATLVYGPSFAGTGMIVTALAANVMVGSLGFVAQTGLMAIGQPRMSLIGDVFMLVVTLGSAAILVVPYGALGAALATLVGVAFGTAIKGGTLVWLMRALDRANFDPLLPRELFAGAEPAKS
jgi:O-antigen/teichoic acid export membrane protein